MESLIPFIPSMRPVFLFLFVVFVGVPGFTPDRVFAQGLIPAPPKPPAGLGMRLLPEQVAAAAARVDEAILQMDLEIWTKQRKMQRPSEQKPFEVLSRVSDEGFIRRVYLDLQARNPDPATVRAFLGSSHPQKRSVLVDRLLSDPLSGARRFLRLADMLRVKDAVLGSSLHAYVEWLRVAAAQSMSYDLMVKELILAKGDVTKSPAAGFLMTDAGQMVITTQEMVRVFLDENIQCASCHDHPYSDTTQMQYYQMAACFSGVQVVKSGPAGLTQLWPTSDITRMVAEPVLPGEQLLLVPARQHVPLLLPKNYLYRDAKPGAAVKPGLPLWTPQGMGATKALGVTPQQLQDSPQEIARWLVDNPRFAEVAALRTFRELFGFPVVEGWEQVQEEKFDGKTAASIFNLGSCEGAGPRSVGAYEGELFGAYRDKNADLSRRRFGETLAAVLTYVKFDLREFERVLCNTQAYHRVSVEVSRGELPAVSAPVFRRLPAEAIWNNLVQVQTDGSPSGKMLMSHELPQVPDKDHPSRSMGRSAREWGDDSLRKITHPLVLTVMTGENVRLASAMDGPLVRRLAATQPGDLAVEEAFLVVLGRLPSQKEKIATLDYAIQNPGTAWSDIVWALLNTSEFVFQY